MDEYEDPTPPEPAPVFTDVREFIARMYLAISEEWRLKAELLAREGE